MTDLHKALSNAVKNANLKKGAYLYSVKIVVDDLRSVNLVDDSLVPIETDAFKKGEEYEGKRKGYSEGLANGTACIESAHQKGYEEGYTKGYNTGFVEAIGGLNVGKFSAKLSSTENLEN